jgi:hypothetical protein
MNKKESWRTRNSKETCLGRDDLSRREIAIPGSGPSNYDVKGFHNFQMKIVRV